MIWKWYIMTKITTVVTIFRTFDTSGLGLSLIGLPPVVWLMQGSLYLLSSILWLVKHHKYCFPNHSFDSSLWIFIFLKLVEMNSWCFNIFSSKSFWYFIYLNIFFIDSIKMILNWNKINWYFHFRQQNCSKKLLSWSKVVDSMKPSSSIDGQWHWCQT